jgi:carboxypeptidase PM20D1
MLKRFALALLVAVFALAIGVGVNTWRQGSRQIEVQPIAKLPLDEEGAAQRLAASLRFKTISNYEQPELNADQFLLLHEYLQKRYPKAHSVLKRELVGKYSLLYTWPGSDSAAKPFLLMSHQDVVPIAPGTEPDWKLSPFGGEVADGFVWGRGAWDNKGNLIAQMEAIEVLAAAGFQPKRTLYLAMGHDEEVGGTRGALEVAKLLQARGVRLDFVLDEGLLITDGMLPGLSQKAALIGIAEKGFLSVVLKVNSTPGHSSMPPAKGTSAIAMMSASLRRIEDEQLPANIRGVAREMFETLAPEMSGFGRVALSNLWLFRPVVQAQLEKGASTNAMLRTTTALTVVNAGNKDNVLPGNAQATVNFRLLPGDTRESVTEHVRSAVTGAVGGPDAAGKPQFELFSLAGSSEPSLVSPTASPSYQLINRTVRELFPDTLVAPGLMIAATDSRHMQAISDHIYRFSPVVAKPEDLKRFHGTNERISVSNFADGVRFYHRLVSQSASK